MLDDVNVPEQFEPVFRMAQDYVKRYFSEKKENPSTGSIEIHGERYILVRAASMSVDFFETVKNLYAAEGEEEALNVALSMLFDIAHAIGKADARNFHEKMNLKDPIEKLSAGPLHFAHSGWAFVHIFPDSNPTPDEDYYLIYDHPFSFESHAWTSAGKKSSSPVCIMNAGYSSGWCEESFEIPLVSSEIMCKAKGDEACRFIMATPAKIEGYIKQYLKREPELAGRVTRYEIPGFFKRKQLEDERRKAQQELKKAHDELEKRVEERTAELKQANESLQEEINERKRAEEALRDSEEMFRTITGTAADAITLVDDQGKVRYWNPAAENIFGYGSVEILGKELHALVMPDTQGQVFEKGFSAFTKTGKGPIVGKTAVFQAVRKDGTAFPAEISVSSLKIKGRWHALGIIRDVTERSKMEEEINNVRRLESMGILAGGIAHDFNNLLTGILGNISLARAFLGSEKDVRESLQEAEKASIQAKNLSNRLLTFSRGGAPVKETSSVAELIKDSTGFALTGSKVKPEYAIDEELWPVEIDKGQIAQVIHNLVINADQAMPEGGTVTIGAHNVEVEEKNRHGLPEGRYVRISVDDCGEGIPEEHRSKIFDPYFSTKSNGSGIGLSIVYSIIKHHDGAVTVETGTGTGTTFNVYLPASDEKITGRFKVVGIFPAAGGRILLMDDSELVAKVATGMLEHMGYEVDVVGDGASAVELFGSALASGLPYDAVIMDLTVPGGSGGREVIRKLRELDPNVKAVVSSGYADDPVMSEYGKYGFSGVVVKPYTIEDLGAVLRKVLGVKED